MEFQNACSFHNFAMMLSGFEIFPTIVGPGYLAHFPHWHIPNIFFFKMIIWHIPTHLEKVAREICTLVPRGGWIAFLRDYWHIFLFKNMRPPSQRLLSKTVWNDHCSVSVKLNWNKKALFRKKLKEIFFHKKMSGRNWKRNEEKLKKIDLTALLHPGQKRRHQVPCISGVSWDSYLLLPEFCIILCFPASIFVLPEFCVFWISVFLLTVAWVGVCRPLVGVGFPRTLRHIHVLRSPGPRVSPENLPT